ncbi:MAG: VanZ family protein [Prevotella sp.]|nr:VanZ family protein [Prevotella sp.]
MKKTFYLLRHYPLTLVCVALVWFLSLFIYMPETPLDDVPFIDKWTHLVMYGGMCIVMWVEHMRCHKHLVAWKLWLYAVLGPIAMGGVIELLQKYATTNRSGEWLDFWADSLGVVLGAVVGLTIHRIRQRVILGTKKDSFDKRKG